MAVEDPLIKMFLQRVCCRNTNQSTRFMEITYNNVEIIGNFGPFKAGDYIHKMVVNYITLEVHVYRTQEDRYAKKFKLAITLEH